MKDFATGKNVRDTPEERVRQEYERILVESYGYRKSDLDIEVRIPRGSGFFPDRADIAIYDGYGRDPAANILGIVETKSPNTKPPKDETEKAQPKSYMTATSAQWGVWTNGDNIIYYCRQGQQILDDYLNNIPARGQSIEDVGRLTKSALRPFGRSELKAVFRRILNTLYANTNIGRREKLGSEMMKLIFSKLKDETTYVDLPPAFRAEAGENPINVAERVKALFENVKSDLKDDGIFHEHESITLDARSVAWVVGQLERGSLQQTDTDVVGDAFEIFSESRFIGEKGEFFTPRGVVRIAIALTKPNPEETVCDPACGSGGFLIHAMKYVWEKIANDPKWSGAPDIKNQQRQLAARTFFGIDKETDLVKIAKAHMAIAGDGRSNIVHENSLHRADHFEGQARIVFVSNAKFRKFNVVLTNPPYATKTKVLADDAAAFILGHQKQIYRDGRWESEGKAVQRDPYVLFIELCLNLLEDGGSLGIVLPETVFHAPRSGYLRRFLLTDNNLKAVVSVPHNAFRPHCNAKTCLLVLTKGARQQDRVIMANPQEVGHTQAGNPLYRPGTEELWDDLPLVLEELSDPGNPNNEHVFMVNWSDIDEDILIPSYYQHRLKPVQLPEGCVGIRLGDLAETGMIEHWDGHGSPESAEKGRGDIPYIRVKDIVNWELYRNPLDGVTEEVFEKMTRNKRHLEEGDIVFVRRGSYRIGTVAMASPLDGKLVLTRELLTFRLLNDLGKGWSPFYLLYLLSTPFVQAQMKHLTFMDTTLPNIGDRWKDLILPAHEDIDAVRDIGRKVEQSIRDKWRAQARIDELRQDIGGLTT